MSFTTPSAISLVVWIFLIQHFPPPPVPPLNGDLSGVWVIERRNGTPITGGANGDIAVYNDYSFDRWFRMYTNDKKIRGWKGYAQTIQGIQSNIIIPTSDGEWDAITQYAADSGRNLQQICDLCYEKSGANGGTVNYIPPACQVFPISIYWNFVLVFSGFVIVVFHSKHKEKTS